MIDVCFYPPDGNPIDNITPEEFKRLAIDNFEEYWMQGSGDGYIDCCVGTTVRTLLIGPNIEYGIYLHLMEDDKEAKTEKDYLSLYDRTKLHEVAETADEIYASVGLFLPLDLAYEGIKHFLLTGELSDKITWVTPDIIPEDGNW